VFKIVHAEFIAPGIKRFVIEAPRIARKQQPGQFLHRSYLRRRRGIPLTIERSDPRLGTVKYCCAVAW
jgi:ferredoxin--NADP+ reductase